MVNPDDPTASLPEGSEWWTSPRLAALMGGYLLLAGAGLTAIGTVLPHSTPIDARDFWLLCAAQVVLGIAMLGSTRLSAAAGERLAMIAVFGAVLTISAAVLLGSESSQRGEVLGLFYVWPALYAGYFFRRAIVAAVVATIAVGFCGASLAGDLSTPALLIRGLITVSVVAGTAAVAHVLRLHVDGLIERLYRLARMDPLTTVMNRRGFDERLNDELERMRRTGQPLSLVLGDVDHFKLLNDRFGHAAGDEALRALGRVLASAVRSVDTVARVGGEEFAVLMPATDRPAAVQAAERLRGRISAVSDPAGDPIEITVGLASTDSAECEDAAGLLLAADRALYTGKTGGRNTTVVYDPRMRQISPSFGIAVPAAE